MIADSERREVARRLRGIKDTRDGCGHDMCCDLWSAVFDSDYRCTDLCDECEVAVLDSLADLIEPTKPVDFDGFAVERDALLALADEMERIADENRMTGMMGIGRARSWADRIREALGVQDA